MTKTRTSCAVWRGEGTRESMSHDRLYDEGEVTKVDGRTISFGSSWCFGGFPDGVEIPRVGDHLRLYGGFGRQVCGADVNYEPRYWISVEEMDRQNAEALARSEARREREFADGGEARLDADFETLPAPLQARIAALREAGGREWRVENESYEMFVSTQAAAIAELGTDEAVLAWRDATTDVKREQVPAFDDGHSGNTLVAAIALARLLVLDRDADATEMPAALSPIVGDPRYPESSSR